jgi:hypothetical protein
MTETQITYRSEGVDSLGTPTAVYLRNVRTGRRHEVDLTSWASDSEAHATYLIGLAERHVGGAT